jgi:hypothetical protein
MEVKLIRNGKVAVLISEGYGAGWSSWNDEYPDMIFDPEIAQMVEDGKTYKEIDEVATKKYPKAYLGGSGGLVVKWLPIGTQFIVEEYDGYESLLVNSETEWRTA